MIHKLGEVVLRPIERKDLEALYEQKNDPEVVALLGGFGHGYSRKNLEEWHASHSARSDEVLWTIADTQDDRCLGHVGYYHVDHRIRSAEFAIMLGDRSCWGKGVGRKVTSYVVDYGFTQMNLNRVHLTVLASNPRAAHIYETIGFKREGVMRQAQFKNGQYLDVVVMGLLRQEFVGDSARA